MTESPNLQNVIESSFDPNSPRAKANRAALKELLEVVRSQEETIRQGGGPKAVAAQHAKKRLTVRERLDLLLDKSSQFLELGLWAAYEMYGEFGGAPGAGVVTGIGRVCGRLCMIIANDATVKAGAFFPMTAKKVLRAQRIAARTRLVSRVRSNCRTPNETAASASCSVRMSKSNVANPWSRIRWATY